jgi:hypothetical protein
LVNAGPSRGILLVREYDLNGREQRREILGA